MLHAQNVGIGTTTPHPTALLELQDTLRGLLIPRLTTEQRDAIPSPAHALIIFNIDSFCLEVYDTATQQWYTISCARNCFAPTCMPSIQGPAFVCAGDTATYSATAFCNVGYEWQVPPGWTIISGQGTPTIAVQPDTTDGTITLTLCNQCGCNSPTTLTVTAQNCNTFCSAIGGASYEEGYAIVQTTDGGYAIAGRTTSFGQGNSDVYVVKIDAQGNLQWTRTIGGSNDEYARSITQTTDGGYIVAGYTMSFGAGLADAYVVKLDAQGTVQWTRTIGGNNWDEAFDIIQTTDGGYALVGFTNTFGLNNSRDVYVVKLDANGNIQWTRTVGGVNNEYGYSIIQTTDGGYAIAGWTHSFGVGLYDVYVVKLDASGNIQWTRTVGGSNTEEGLAIIQTTDGGYAIAGFTWSFGQGADDIYVIKLNAQGGVQWTRTIGGPNNERGHTIVQTADGGYAVAGWTTSFANGGAYLVKLDAQGTLQWTKVISGGGSNGMTATSDGGFAIVGATSSAGQGQTDVFIVKVDGNGNLHSCPSGCQIASGGVSATGGVVSSGGVCRWV